MYMYMKGQIQTQKYGFTVNFASKNMGDNFILVVNLIARNYFLRYYITELRKNGNC